MRTETGYKAIVAAIESDREGVRSLLHLTSGEFRDVQSRMKTRAEMLGGLAGGVSLETLKARKEELVRTEREKRRAFSALKGIFFGRTDGSWPESSTQKIFDFLPANVRTEEGYRAIADNIASRNDIVALLRFRPNELGGAVERWKARAQLIAMLSRGSTLAEAAEDRKTTLLHPATELQTTRVIDEMTFVGWHGGGAADRPLALDFDGDDSRPIVRAALAGRTDAENAMRAASTKTTLGATEIDSLMTRR